MVAMANSGGGRLLVGVTDDGFPSEASCRSGANDPEQAKRVEGWLETQLTRAGAQALRLHAPLERAK